MSDRIEIIVVKNGYIYQPLNTSQPESWWVFTTAKELAEHLCAEFEDDPITDALITCPTCHREFDNVQDFKIHAHRKK